MYFSKHLKNGRPEHECALAVKQRLQGKRVRKAFFILPVNIFKKRQASSLYITFSVSLSLLFFFRRTSSALAKILF